MSVVIENRSTLGDKFVKGMNARLYDIVNQADLSYSLEIESALGIEKNNATALFKKFTTDQARETFGGKTGLGRLALTSEGSNYASDSRISTYETQFNPIKKTSGITITEEMRDDGIADRKLSENADLIVSSKMTLDEDGFDIFNKSFTAQSSLPDHLTYYGDGVPFMSTIHPIKDTGGTQSNASASGIVLNETNLGTGRQALRRQLDDKANPTRIGSGRLILLVPDSLEQTAAILANSQHRVGTANNDINIYYDGVVTVISTKWINSQNGGSDTQWFLIDSMFHPLRWCERQGIKITTYDTNANKNFTTDISLRYQFGNIDWRGVWGSKGDLGTYSA